MKNFSKSVTVFLICAGSNLAPLVHAQSGSSEGDPIVKLGPNNSLAQALNKFLPNYKSSFHEETKAVAVPNGLQDTFLVINCATAVNVTRVATPFHTFKGCEITEQAEVPEGMVKWSLLELLKKGITAAAVHNPINECHPLSRVGC